MPSPAVPAAACLSRAAGAACPCQAAVSSSCARYRSRIRSSHASVQYFSWAGFASPARTKCRRMCAQQYRFTRPSAFLPGGLVHLVEIAGDHQPPRPAVPVVRELPGLLVDAGVPGQHLPGPGRVHDEADGVRAEEHPQPPFRRAAPRAGRTPAMWSRPRAGARNPATVPRSRPASGASSAPACAHVPAKVAGRSPRRAGASPVTSEFWLRPAAYRSVSSIAMNPLENRPLPIAFGGPGAVTVAGTRAAGTPCGTGGGSPPAPARSPSSPAAPRRDRTQQRERHPAPRAAVPAPREIPDHLEPGQVRVIPPPRPRPRPPLPARAVPAVPAGVPAAGIAGTRPRRRLLRRPAEHHPLQHRQLCQHPLKLGLHAARHAPAAAGSPPAAWRSPPAAPQPAAPSAGSPPAPGPAHPSARRQHLPPRRRQPRQSRSTANTPSSPQSRTTPGVSPAVCRGSTTAAVPAADTQGWTAAAPRPSASSAAWPWPR